MRFPEALRQLAATPGFWLDYLFDEEGPGATYPALRGVSVEFDVCPGYQLTLGLDEHLAYHSLGFRHPGVAEPWEIGFDDQAHWHPNALRWEELDLIGRCVALIDPALPHPGLPVVLLNRFAPVCLDTDADVTFPMVESAWRSLGLFEGRRLRELVERYDRRHAEFTWRRETAGWVLGQPEGAEERTGWVAYTLRHPEADFPFEAWDAFLAAAEGFYASRARQPWRTEPVLAAARAAAGEGGGAGGAGGASALAAELERAGCRDAGILAACRSREAAQFGWAIELLLGAPRGSVIRRLLGPSPRRRRTWYEYWLTWPEPPDRPPGAGTAASAVADALDAALRKAGLGRAEVAAASSVQAPDGRWVAASCEIEVRVCDDAERGVALVREVLAGRPGADGARFRQARPERRAIPLRV